MYQIKVKYSNGISSVKSFESYIMASQEQAKLVKRAKKDKNIEEVSGVTIKQ